MGSFSNNQNAQSFKKDANLSKDKKDSKMNNKKLNNVKNVKKAEIIFQKIFGKRSTNKKNDLSDKKEICKQNAVKNIETTFDNFTTQIKKNIYSESQSISTRKLEEIEKFRDSNEIRATGDKIPFPIQFFTDYKFPDYIREEFSKLNFVAPTPIQAQSWPIVLSGRDLVGIAETGSGKTLSYLLPALVHINHQPSLKTGEGPIVLIMTPTRELAHQIFGVAQKYCKKSKIRASAVYGGVDKDDLICELKKGVELCIATPGRLLGFAETNKVNLSRVSFLVLDEADLMLDMSFGKEISRIINKTHPYKQMSMFSATWPNEVKKLAEDCLYNFIMVNVGPKGLSANHDIVQIVEICTEENKEKRLIDLLNKITKEKIVRVIIFSNFKGKAERIYNALKKDKKLPVESIHSDKHQSVRNCILQEFKEGYFSILVATDLAARGLDVDCVEYVINYDYPNTIEEYVHRIGRTGRCGNRGTAHTFFMPSDAPQASDLIKVIMKANQKVNPMLVQLANSKEAIKAKAERGGNRKFGGKQKMQAKKKLEAKKRLKRLKKRK